MRTECPHCHRHLADEMIADDFSGCPLRVKCASPPGFLAVASAWPDDAGDDDDDTAETLAPEPVLAGGA